MNATETLLTLHNNAVYCLAVVILVSAMVETSFARYCIAFFLTTAAGLLVTVTGRSHLTMPAVVCILTAVFTAEQKDLSRIFSRCLTAVFLSWCLIMPLSCLIMMLAPRWHNSPGCNLLSGAALLLYAVSLRWVPASAQRIGKLEPNRYVILLELLVLSFFTLVLPQYFPTFAVESKRQIGLFTFSFLILLAFVGLILYKMQRVEGQQRQLQASIRQQQDFRQQIQHQYGLVVSFRHYYSKLYQSLAPLIRSGDMDELKSYFEQYITTVHQSHLEAFRLLVNIRSDVIRNLVDVTASQLESMEGITLELEVEGVIEFPGYMEMDIFEILSNLLANAVHALEGQSAGLLRIVMQEDATALSILIANTVKAPFDTGCLNKKGKQETDRHGHGLKRISDIVRQHPQMEHFTYIKGVYEGKEILTQHIKINVRK